MIVQYLAKFLFLAKKGFIVCLLFFYIPSTFGQIRDEFKMRGPKGLQSDPNTCIFSLHGDFTMISNVNVWAATGKDEQTRINNNTNMVKIDLDGDKSTSNSSMAELKLHSSCSEIVYAGLYWTSRTATKVKDNDKKNIKIKGPKANSYNEYSSPIYSRIPGDSYQYVCFTDVTQYVKDQGTGPYWIADIALTEGSDSPIGNYAGWGMVVIYADSELPMRNIAMFDGYAFVSGKDKYTIPINGFKSVQTGPVKVKLGFMAGEGDAGISGDWCQMKKASASGGVNNDADWIHLENPETSFSNQNFWRSRVTNDAGATRNPNYTNNLGFDAFTITIDNTNNQFIGNNQTSSSIRYGTSQDQYIIFNVTMAVDAYEPEPEAVNRVFTKENTWADSKTAGPGENLVYRLDITNNGNEAILNTKIEIPIPFNSTYVPGSFNTVFDPSLSGTSVSYDPAGQKLVVNLGTLPVAPPNNPDKIFASITYQLKTTTDCYYLKNDNHCLRDITLQGIITGTGAITKVPVNKKTISGYEGGLCSQSPISSPTTVKLVVPDSYTGCEGWQNTTPNIRICPGKDNSIPVTTIRERLTLPSHITYVFNSKPDGSGIVYNDNNPFPIIDGTYYAVPVNTINPNCSGSIPFTISILNVSTPPTTPYEESNNSLVYCPSGLPITLVANTTSNEYSIFWYTQESGGNALSHVNIEANTTPGTYTYYLAQGYDAICQSNRIPVTVRVNPVPPAPAFNGSIQVCGEIDDKYTIINPNQDYSYEWSLVNPPAGVVFKNNLSIGNSVSLVEKADASGTFTIKVRAKNNITGCYGEYNSLSITLYSKPDKPASITGPTEACESSIGNIFTLSNTSSGLNYEWSYSGSQFSWVNGSNLGLSTELQFHTGATSGWVGVRAKTSAGCYSDTLIYPVVINERPKNPTEVLGDSICTNENAFITIENSGTLKYQVFSGNTSIGDFISGNNNTLSIEMGKYPVAGNFSYSLKSFNEKCYSSLQTPVSVVVVKKPIDPVILSGVTSCYGIPPVIEILNTVQNNTYSIYENKSLAGNPLNKVIANGPSLTITINDAPTGNKTYYVIANNSICSSQFIPVPVTIHNKIEKPILSNMPICSGQKPAIIVQNPPISNGLFDHSTYQYKVYSDTEGKNEIRLSELPELSHLTEIILHPDTILSNNTTFYVRLIANECHNGPISSTAITIGPRPAPSVISPVKQCLGTNALLTIHNAESGNHYRVYTVSSNGTAIHQVVCRQNGEMLINLPSSVHWDEGTLFYIEESVNNDKEEELCISSRAIVKMENGTPPSPMLPFNPVYTCAEDSASIVITNASMNHIYHIFHSKTGSTKVISISPEANFHLFSFRVHLPSDFVSDGGSITYWLEMEEKESDCKTERIPINIILATPSKPILTNHQLFVCKGKIPVITIANAQKDILYTIYDADNKVITGPVTALENGSLSISLSGINLLKNETIPLFIQAKAPSVYNNCTSAKTGFTLTDGEPIVPQIQNMEICHGAPLYVSIPNPIQGYTYFIHDDKEVLVGTINGPEEKRLTDPNIVNPAYPDAHTPLTYYLKAQNEYCLSDSSTSFKVNVKRTVEVGQGFTISSPEGCEGSDVEIDLLLKAGALVNADDILLKWYNNSNLSGLFHTQTYSAGTTEIKEKFSGLTSGIYTYYVTAESASANLCPNKVQDAGVSIIHILPHATAIDLFAPNHTICYDEPVTLEVELKNTSISNPVYHWYSDSNHTLKVAANSPTFIPDPSLTAHTTYYITVENDAFCENKPGDDQKVKVTVNPKVLPPAVAIKGNTPAICSGENLILNITPSGFVSGYELWENNVQVNTTHYTVNLGENTLTVHNPAPGNHTYTVVSQVVENSILCTSDSSAESAKVNIKVNPPVNAPILSLLSADACQGDSITFQIQYTNPKPSAYILLSGSGEQAPSSYTLSEDMQSIKLLQAVLGHHSYSLISLIDSNGITCHSSKSSVVESDLYPSPSVMITHTGTTNLCQNEQAAFSLTFTGTPPFTYTVEATDIHNQSSYIAKNATTNQNTVSITHNPAVTTQYKVTKLSDTHCTALEDSLKSTLTLHVFSELNAGMLVRDHSICNNTSPGDLNITKAFNGDTSNYVYSWKKWNGITFTNISEALPVATYIPGILTTGEHRFQRTISDGCMVKTTQTIITVWDTLQAGSLIDSLFICNNTSPGNVNRTLPQGGDTTHYEYIWQVWTGSAFEEISSAGNLADYTPPPLTSGTYRFQRSINDLCQMKTAETHITVYSTLNPGNLIASKSVCLNESPGDLNQMLPTGGDTNQYHYIWQIWDGTAFINLDPEDTLSSYIPGPLDQTGTYLYKRTVNDGCQTLSATTQINVYSDLNPGSLIPDTSICNGTSPGNLNRNLATLCGQSKNIDYEWFKEDYDLNWIPLHIYTPDYTPENLSSGTHHYQRRAEDGSDTLYTDVTITVFDNLTSGTLITPLSICNETSPGNLNFSLPSGGDTSHYTYSWQLHGDNTFKDLTPLVNTADFNPNELSTGIYRYQRTVTDGCQTQKTESTITVFSDLDPGILISDTNLCQGISPGELNEVFPSGGNKDQYSYSWQLWDGQIFSNLEPAHTDSVYSPTDMRDAGSYIYQRTVTDNCQTKTIQTTITIHTNPTATIDSEVEICQGDSIPLAFSLTGKAPWTVSIIDNITNTINDKVFNTTPNQYLISPFVNTTYTIKKVTDGNGCITNY